MARPLFSTGHYSISAHPWGADNARLDKAFKSVVVDKIEITSCKYLGIIFIKIVGYTSLENGWVAISNLSGALVPCVNISGKAALYYSRHLLRWKVNHKNFLKKTLDRDLPFLKLSENVSL